MQKFIQKKQKNARLYHVLLFLSSGLSEKDRTMKSRWNSGTRYIMTEQTDSALQILDKDLACRTSDEFHLLAGTWHQKARVYSSINDRSNAILCLSKAFTLEPERRNWVVITSDELLQDLLQDKAVQPVHSDKINVFKIIQNLFSSRNK